MAPVTISAIATSPPAIPTSFPNTQSCNQQFPQDFSSGLASTTYICRKHIRAFEFSGERQFRLLVRSSPAFENTRSDGTLENHLAPVGELLI